MTLRADTRIAGQKTVADWTDFKTRLSRCKDTTLWTQAFNDYFKARLESRYFKPIRALKLINKNDGEGFAIVTLHCSLIEFLAATLEGKNYRYVKRGDPEHGPFEYSKSKEMFQNFLTSQVPFNQMFKHSNDAESFYTDVRCGLLHEARTKGDWLILADCEEAKAIDTHAKVIYRNKMQAAFDEFIQDYGERLKTCTELQEAFIRKFDDLCS